MPVGSIFLIVNPVIIKKNKILSVCFVVCAQMMVCIRYYLIVCVKLQAELPT